MGQARARARHQGVGPIRLVVPFGRDGAADRVARAVASALGEPASIVEDVPGAGGLRGVMHANALAARGEATLLLATPTTHVLLPLQRGAEGTPANDFTPLAYLGGAPNVLLVASGLGVRDIPSLVELAKGRRLVYASAGAGQTIHLCTALFCRQAGVVMEHRPYDAGSATAYGDIEAGRVDVYFDNVLACGREIAAGIVIPLAVSAAARTRLLPTVPTLRECGFPAHALDLWFGLYAARLDAAQKARAEGLVGDATLAAALDALGLSGAVASGTVLARIVRTSRSQWRMALEAA